MSEGPGEPSFADVLNGITGGTPKRRAERRGLFRRRRDEAGDDAERDVGSGAAARPGDVALSAGSPEAAAPRPQDPAVPPSARSPEPDLSLTPPWGLDRADEGPDDESDGESSFVRPYAWTGGRTRPVWDLALETLISLGPQGRVPGRVRQYEHRAVADLCREPTSVAEVAALLGLPLGVARVLIGDMASQGTVVVHQTAGSSDEGPDLALMERVLSGLRRL